MRTNFFTKLLLFAFLVMLGIGAKAQCNSSWLYVVPIGVSNSTTDGFANFQVKVNLPNTAQLVVDGKMKANGADIRFSDAACNNLPYWIENGTFGTTNCVIWVKTLNIPASGTQTVNMFYGNSGASAASDGDATFDLFEDFTTSSMVNNITVPDANKWTTSLSATNSYSFNNGIVTIAGTGSASATEMLSVKSFPSAIIFESNITSISTVLANRGGKPGMAILNNGGAGYTLYDSIAATVATTPIKFAQANSGSGSWAGKVIGTPVTQSTQAIGTWGILWPANGNQKVYWPGGSITGTDNNVAISTQVNVAFGTLASGKESFTADWLRVRKYAKVEPGTTVGNEYSNVVAVTSAAGPYCVGSNPTISYAINGVFNSGNVFTAQLSDANGSFATPYNVGTVSSTSSGTISVALPAGITGSGFQIRILSSTPVYTGVPSAAFSIVSAPANHAGAAKSICLGNSTTIGAAAITGETYSWSSTPADNAFVSSSANPTVSPSQTSVYTLTETNAAGCSSSNDVTVTVNPLPAANAGSATSIINGSSASIGGASVSGSTYSWSPSTGLSDATSANPTASPSSTTTYTVTETNANGCSASNSVKVTVDPLTVSVSGSPLTICLGGNTTLTATTSATNASYQWYNGLSAISGATSSTYVASASGIYTVQVTNGSATATSNAVTVVVNPIPAASVIARTSICAGQSIKIGGSPVLLSSYSWTSDQTGSTVISTSANPSVTPSVTTTYTVVESNLTGCTSTNSVTITVNPLPAANAGSAVSIINGNSTTIGGAAVSGSTYSWSPSTGLSNATAANPTASPSSTTTYTVTETNAAGCTSSNDVKVTVIPATPKINVQGNSVNVPAGSTTVSATNNTDFGTASYGNPTITETYTIQNPGNSALTVSGITVSDASDYTVGGISTPVSIPANGSTTFTVTFNYNALVNDQTLPATITIASNATTNSSYTYAINTKFVSPAINVQGNNNNIANGATVANASATNGTDMGSTTSGTASQVYTIQNTGGDAMTINSVTLVNAPNFTITSPAGSTVASNGSTNFTVGFDASTTTPGTYTGQVVVSYIKNGQTLSYTYYIEATYVAPVIVVKGNGVTIASDGSNAPATADNTNFGNTTTGSASKTFAIADNGNATLNISNVTIGGANASNFSVASFPSTVSANGSQNFNVNFSATVTGTYTATVTVASNDAKTPSYTYNIKACALLPAITAGGATTFCQGGSVTLSSNSGPSYQWNNASGPISGATAQTLTVSAAGSYYVTQTTGSTIANSNTITVTVNALPAAKAGTSTSICAGNATTIGATAVSGSTYAWTSNQTGSTVISTSANPSVSPSVATTYTVTETNAAGCKASNSVTIGVNAVPAANAGSASTITNGSSASIGGAAVSGSTYSWTSSPSGFTSTSANPTVSPSATTTYTVTETNAAGCTASHSVTVTVNPLKITATAGGPTSYCDGGSVVLTASAASNYQWNDDNGPILGETNQTYTAISTGNYYVTTSNGAVTASSNVIAVTENPLPAANAGATQTICAGTSTTIGATAVSGSTYSWTSFPTGFTSTSANPSVSPSDVTAYTVTETSAAGCTNSNSVTVKVNAAPTPDAGMDQTMTQGSTVTLGNSGNATSTYSWTSSPAGFSSTNPNPTVSPSATTTYTVTETNENGCVGTDKAVITVNPLKATITTNDPTSFCAGDNADLMANTADSYQWSNASGNISGATAQVYTATASGTYYITITNGNASAKSAGTVITVNALPADHSGADQTVCAGTSVTLGQAAISGSTYSWTSDPAGFTSTSANPTVTPSLSTIYTLTETNASGCSSTNSASVTVNPLPSATTGGAQTINSGSTTTIGGPAVSGNTYAWTSSPSGFTSTSANPSVSPTTTTTYSLTETSAAGCKTTHTVTITVQSTTKPTICITGSTTFCAGGSVKLTASNGYSYQWYNGSTAISGATSQAYTATASGTYSVAVKPNSYSSAVSSASVTVTVIALPAANAGTSVSICAGSSASIGAAAVSGSTYKWTANTSYCGGFSSTASKLTVTPSATTTYTLTETNASGCSKSNSVTVTVVAKPNVTLSCFASVCASSSAFTLSGGSPAGGTYTVDGGSATTTFNPMTSSVGQHKIVYTYTNSTGCSGSAYQYITVKTGISKPTISTCGSTTICGGGSVKLTSSSAGCSGSYQWSNQNGPLMTCGSTSQSLTVSTSGTYYVTVTSNGCSSTSDGIVVSVGTAPTVSAGSDVTFNYGYDNYKTLSATSNTTGVTYQWSTGATTQSINVSPCKTTTYWVKVFKNGCASCADYVTVNVRDVHCYHTSDCSRSSKCVICHYDSYKKQWGHKCVYKTDVTTCQNNGDKFDDCGDYHDNIAAGTETFDVYPNPLTTSTNVRLSFEADQQVTVDVVTLDGKTAQVVYNGNVISGSPYNFTIDATNLQSGVYMVRVMSGDHMDIRKIIVLKQN